MSDGSGVKVQFNGGWFFLSFALFSIFMVLKLTEHIDWSWLWVFGPFWIPIASVFLVFIVAFVIMLIMRGVQKLIGFRKVSKSQSKVRRKL